MKNKKHKVYRILKVSLIVVVVAFLFTTILMSAQEEQTPAGREEKRSPGKFRFSVGLKGGWSYWGLRDFDLAKAGHETFAEEDEWGVEFREIKKSSFLGINLSLDFNLPNFHKAGLSTGFRYLPGGSYKQNLFYDVIRYDESYDLSAYAIPFELHYKIPAGDHFFIKLSGGIEYFRVSLDYDSKVNSGTTAYFWRGKLKDSGIGGLVSLGGEFLVKKTFSLTFEAGYARAKFDNFTGDIHTHRGKWEDILLIMARDEYGENFALQSPSLPLFENERPAEMDISGFRFSIGFKITVASK